MLHLGIMELIIDNPTYQISDIYNEKDKVTKYIRQYYLYDLWSDVEINNLINDEDKNLRLDEFLKSGTNMIQTIRNISRVKVETKVLNRAINVYEIVKLLYTFNITEL